LLFKVLKNLELLGRIDESEFLGKTNNESSICSQLNAVFDLYVEPYKVQIADELGWILNNSAFYWYQDENNFMEETELGRFLDFVINMR